MVIGAASKVTFHPPRPRFAPLPPTFQTGESALREMIDDLGDSFSSASWSALPSALKPSLIKTITNIPPKPEPKGRKGGGGDADADAEADGE